MRDPRLNDNIHCARSLPPCSFQPFRLTYIGIAFFSALALSRALASSYAFYITGGKESSDKIERRGIYRARRREPTENRRKESSSKDARKGCWRLGKAITLIMKGIHSTARPTTTVSLSDVVADSCLNLIGPHARPSIRPLTLSRACDFFYDIV